MPENTLAWQLYADLEGQILIHSTVDKANKKKPGKPFIVVKIEALDCLFRWYGIPEFPSRIRLRLWEKIKTIQAVYRDPEKYKGYEV